MRFYSKWLVLMVALVVLAGTALAGCSSSNGSSSGGNASTGSSSGSGTATAPSESGEGGPDISRRVKLTWIALGDPPKDFDAVKAELNKKTIADLNAEVDFVWVGWGELGSKYALLLTSGQNADLVYTAGWLDYNTRAKQGAFTALTPEMLETYAPAALEKLPPEAWKNATVDGNIIAVPRNFLEYQDAGVAYRGDIMEKAGLSSISSIEDVAKYLEAGKEAEPNVVPFNAGADVGDFVLTEFILRQQLKIPVPGTGNFFHYNPLEPNPQIASKFDDPLILEAYPKIREIFQNGSINKNVLNNKVPSRQSFKNGQSLLATYGDNQFRDDYDAINQARPEWKVGFQSFSPDGPFIKQSYDTGMMAIPSASRNKERALMLMDKFFSDEAYYMLMIYGIEGKHWEYTADRSMIQVPEGADATLYPKWQYPWGFGDWVSFNKPSVTDYPEYAKKINLMRETAVHNPYINFMPDTGEIINELSALNNVDSKYSGAFLFGAVDPVETLPKVEAELKAAGYEKVKAEIQRQLDAYTPEPE